MAVLAFDGSDDRLLASTLSTTLRDVPNGAYTFAYLMKRRSSGTPDALGYLSTSAPATLSGLSILSDVLQADISGAFGSSVGVTSTTTSHILVISRPAGASQELTYSKFPKDTTTWSHDAASGSTVSDDPTDAEILELGTWQAGDFAHMYLGVFAIWDRALTQGQKEELDNNWRTSDWWNVSGGAPVCLIETTSTSPTDLAAGASNWSTAGGLGTAAETLDSWTFDGTGAPPPGVGVAIPDYSRFPKHKLQRTAA